VFDDAQGKFAQSRKSTDIRLTNIEINLPHVVITAVAGVTALRGRSASTSTSGAPNATA